MKYVNVVTMKYKNIAPIVQTIKLPGGRRSFLYLPCITV